MQTDLLARLNDVLLAPLDEIDSAIVDDLIAEILNIEAAYEPVLVARFGSNV
jgi:hypothetical protein